MRIQGDFVHVTSEISYEEKGTKQGLWKPEELKEEAVESN